MQLETTTENEINYLRGTNCFLQDELNSIIKNKDAEIKVLTKIISSFDYNYGSSQKRINHIQDKLITEQTLPNETDNSRDMNDANDTYNNRDVNDTDNSMDANDTDTSKDTYDTYYSRDANDTELSDEEKYHIIS